MMELIRNFQKDWRVYFGFSYYNRGERDSKSVLAEMGLIVICMLIPLLLLGGASFAGCVAIMVLWISVSRESMLSRHSMVHMLPIEESSRVKGLYRICLIGNVAFVVFSFAMVGIIFAFTGEESKSGSLLLDLVYGGARVWSLMYFFILFIPVLMTRGLGKMAGKGLLISISYTLLTAGLLLLGTDEAGNLVLYTDDWAFLPDTMPYWYCRVALWGVLIAIWGWASYRWSQKLYPKLFQDSRAEASHRSTEEDWSVSGMTAVDGRLVQIQEKASLWQIWKKENRFFRALAMNGSGTEFAGAYPGFLTAILAALTLFGELMLCNRLSLTAVCFLLLLFYATIALAWRVRGRKNLFYMAPVSRDDRAGLILRRIGILMAMILLAGVLEFLILLVSGSSLTEKLQDGTAAMLLWLFSLTWLAVPYAVIENRQKSIRYSAGWLLYAIVTEVVLCTGRFAGNWKAMGYYLIPAVFVLAAFALYFLYQYFYDRCPKLRSFGMQQVYISVEIILLITAWMVVIFVDIGAEVPDVQQFNGWPQLLILLVCAVASVPFAVRQLKKELPV